MTHSDSEFDYPREEIKNKRPWPKEWIDAMRELVHHAQKYDGEEWNTYFNFLDKAGALKDPPQPREIWWCPDCRGTSYTGKMYCYEKRETNGLCDSIKMREVIE